jgi:protoporphyrinogen oxidase
MLRHHHPEVTFEDFAVRRFGETLARRILLNYSAKLWGLPTDQLSPDVATRRLQGMTLRSLLYELVFPGAKTEHVDGSFLYPRKGYGQIAEAIVGTLPAASIRTGCEVSGLECEEGVLTRLHLAGGKSLDVDDRVVSTLPMPFLVKLLGDSVPEPARAAASRLRFRHVRLLFVRIRADRMSGNASIYIPDPAFCVSRIYEPKNRSAEMAPEGETSFVVEAPCFEGDAIERLPVPEFAERVIGELVTLRLLNRRDVIETRHHFIPNAYPVYTNGYARDVRAVRDGLSGIVNLETIGRAGRFVYSHLHDQMRFGKDFVKGLSDPVSADSGASTLPSGRAALLAGARPAIGKDGREA